MRIDVSSRIDLSSFGCEILISEGLLGRCGGFFRPFLGRGRLFVVSDPTIYKLWGEVFSSGLQAEGVSLSWIFLPSGEKAKSFSAWEKLLADLLSEGIERQDGIACLGGGAVGDSGGFAASTVLRGVPLFQVPTTLLAQVDSSIGGKTGINSFQGKNLVGSFYHPRLVVCDPEVLCSLDSRQLRAGYAEIVKAALIAGEDFFGWLEGGGGLSLLSGDKTARLRAIRESARVKADIVRTDARESSGRRELLNLGHSFAHALEKLAGYDASLLHGEAVATGLFLAFHFSQRLGLCAPRDVLRVCGHLRRVGLRPHFPRGFVRGDRLAPDACSAILSAMSKDKKNRNGRIHLVLSRGIGRIESGFMVSGSELLDFLTDATLSSVLFAS